MSNILLQAHMHSPQQGMLLQSKAHRGRRAYLGPIVRQKMRAPSQIAKLYHFAIERLD